MDYEELFHSLFPGFFNDPGIRSMPENQVSTELILDLRKKTPISVPFTDPGGILFGEYHGDFGKLKEAVGRVEEEWVQYFDEGNRVYCAFDGEQVISFCILSDWGNHAGLHIGGPGCVGTIPEYRRKGIGLEMVRRGTMILKEEGFDLSWIHYTHVGPWYEKLGYRNVLRWNCKGFIASGRPACGGMG